MGTIRTMDVLRGFGFRPDPTTTSYDGSTITFDFGILKLRATSCMNLRCQQIVLFSGVITTPRSIGEVHFELPQEIDSVKLCAALIAWNLDQFSAFKEIHHADWVEEGRRNKKLLPWVKSMAEWNARPQCAIKRDWLRLGLKTIAGHLRTMPDDADVLFRFDGSVLSIKCDGKVIALAGEGVPWGVSFKVQVGALRRLPTRLMREDIGISIWESTISIGNRTYPGIIEELGTTYPSRVQ